jgi:hypothetical protein
VFSFLLTVGTNLLLKGGYRLILQGLRELAYTSSKGYFR